LTEESWLAEVTWEGEQVFVGSADEGHSVVYDRTTDGLQRGIGPMRALLVSLGACSGMDVVALLKKRRQSLTSLKILLSGERPQQGHPRPYKTIQLKYVVVGVDLDREYVAQAIDDSMKKFCSVAATLRPGAKIDYNYELSSR
jgi:putative redox protein